MREILFRGKRIDNGKWVEGFLCEYHGYANGKTYVDSFISRSHYACSYLVSSSSVGQYTGLTDKNGKKIFEGDIVRTKFGRLCIIRHFVSPYFCGIDLFPLNTKHRPPTEYDMYQKEFLEVIGNIIDSPDFTEA